MKLLTDKIEFPSVDEANDYGILAVGGDLSIERLKLAYQSGIFPWYEEGQPIVWYSPDPRMILFPENLCVSKSMRKVLRTNQFRVTWNVAFEEVVTNCKQIDRTAQGELGTWITEDMKWAYLNLHKVGIAHSIEVWEGNELVGGLYGVAVGKVFCGESMFSKVSNASKVAFIHLAQSQKYKLIDCQIYNDHLASLGAEEIPREWFMELLLNNA